MRIDGAVELERFGVPGELARRWGCTPMMRVGEASNYVYEIEQKRYLRITAAKHRECEQIEAELEFVQHLHRSGCAVALPVSSRSGRLVETISTEAGTYSACVFEEAPGTVDSWGDDAWNKKVLSDQGEALGRIHLASRRFEATRSRFDWKADGFVQYIARHLPASQQAVRKEIDEVMNWASGQAMDQSTYGVIHGDFGILNYRREGGVLTAFDFDDCCRHFYLFDVAVTLRPASRLPQNARQEYLRVFVDSYERAAEADVVVKDLEKFTRLVNVNRYVDLIRKWDLTALSERQQTELKDRYDAVIRGGVG